jgi:putative heme-binding domain-containing protein
VFLAVSLLAFTAGAQNAAPIEALQRLKGMDLEANPALKAAVLRVAEQSRGTPEYVAIVRDFKLAGQRDGLLEAAVKFAGESAGTDAARLLLAQDDGAFLAAKLKTGHPHEAAPLAQALGQTGDRAAVPLLLAALANDDHVVRSGALRGLARTQEGARELLRLAREEKLDERGRTTAALELAQARWPDIQAEAAQLLPPPAAGDGEPLPPVDELVKLTGDPARGAKIFRSEQVACSRCHKVGEEGVDFGPALTEIGTKLDRRALYDSILDPNAGIAFGYEGWAVETRQGEELFGILASETADELAIKDQTGIVTRVKKAEVTRREPQKSSLMPAGLAQAMTKQELVDLIEYLTTLKKRP